MKIYTTILALLLVGMRSAFSQGFINLDFESANLSGFSPGSVPATDAIPGWTAYLGGAPVTNVFYDLSPSVRRLGVYIYDYGSLQGTYSIYLAGTSDEPASIGQSGTIPATAQSLVWWGFVPDGLSFNGQPLSWSTVGEGADYVIFATDISALAGQTGQLLFTSDSFPGAPWIAIDNIQFQVPEPGVFSLFALGGLCFLWRRRRFC
jgi:PEP-CTERM motif